MESYFSTKIKHKIRVKNQISQSINNFKLYTTAVCRDILTTEYFS